MITESTLSEPATRRGRNEWVWSGRRSSAIWWLVQTLLIILLVSWRGISLGADPPADFIPKDVGYQIDEGYKTLSPRNLALFHVTHWNEADVYPGWMGRSPVTQWLDYFSFRAFGVRRESARAVSILFFAALLFAAAVFLNRRGPPAVALAGIVLLGTDMALFHFSRVGIFEVALCSVLYTGVFVANSLPPTRRFAHLVVLVVTAIVGAFGVKASALLYLAPPLAVLLLVELLGTSAGSRAKKVVIGTAVPLALALLYLTSDIWQNRIDVGAAIDGPSRLLFHPIYLLSPLAISLAYLATIDIYFRLGFREFRENRYLLTIASIALLAPLLLAAFRYHPPRYYVAVVPAALLVVVEWLRLYPVKLSDKAYRLSPVRLGVGALIMLPLTASVAGFVGTHLIAALPFIPQGEDPGIDLTVLVKLFPIMLAAAAVVTLILVRRKRLHSVVVGGILIGIVLQVLFSARSDLRAVFQPTYATDRIQRRLVGVVAQGESIGGDWAPYFALGTTIPALYMSKELNTHNIEETRPTYFLNSNTVWDNRTLEGLEANREIGVGDPIPVGTVFGHEVELRRLSYRVLEGRR